LPPLETLNQIYREAVDTYARPDSFRVKRDGAYRDVSMETFARAGSEIALGLIALGLKPGERVALLSETRLEWAEADMGILTAGLVSVPIYPTLASGTVEHILKDSGARVLLASSPDQAAKIDAYRRGEPGFPVVLLEGSREGCLTLEDLRARGRQLGEGEPELHRRRWDAVGPEDLATLIYTSGTTGPPKGVMLTHRNIASNVEAGLQVLKLTPADTCLAFLPLSHILERMAGHYCMLHGGATIAYAESIDTVPENLGEVRPTVVVSVPRLYEKMYARILDTASAGGPVKKNLFFWARQVGLRWADEVLAGRSVGLGLALQYRVAQALVFRKLKTRTGGRLRFFVSGGAPLAVDIARFFFAAGLPILEGYGLTETSPLLSVNTLDRIRPGTVGPPAPGVEIRIAGDGEILARGPNIMKGYYNQPEATAEVMQGGWFHTGDIGHLDPDGYLVITDRKKDLIVTAGGKNVAPQPIESRLKTDKFLTEVVVLGDRRPYLVALVIPNFENLASYAKLKGIAAAGPSELVRHPAIREFLERRVARLQEGSAPFECIKKMHVLDRDLEIGAELTPTLKVKRKEIAKRFHDEIEALYGS